MNFRVYSRGIRDNRRVVTLLGDFTGIAVSDNGLYYKLVISADIFAGAVLDGDEIEILYGLD